MMEQQKRWYAEQEENLLANFQTTRKGLSSADALQKLKQYGPNQSDMKKKDTALKIFFRQFKNFVIMVLVTAAGLSFITRHEVEGIVILCIICITAGIGFLEEYKASKDMDELLKLNPKKAKVIRDGRQIDIDAKMIVPGDILVLRRGDIVSADARLLESSDLKIDESSLTGESMPVTKKVMAAGEGTPLAQQHNMIFASTKILNGNGLALAVETGNTTEIGKISKMVTSIQEEITPLQKRLEKMSKKLSIMAIMMAMIIFVIGITRGTEWATMMIFSLAILISGIPESLPAVVAVTLAAGVKKMASKNAIIKRLPAVETLGTCTIICTDKTGTLTQNKMLVENIFTTDAEVNVTGEGYNPQGIFLRENITMDPKKHETISKAIEIGVLCNNAELQQKDGEWRIDGEATEGALIVLGNKAGLNKKDMHLESPRKKEHPFDPERKCMSVIHNVKNKNVVYSKGAPELLLAKAKFYFHKGRILKLTPKIENIILEKNNEYASKGLRVLGLAFKAHKGSFEELKNIESSLIFVGLVSIRDPPHEGVKESIIRCKEAGTKVVMITGDNPVTAKAIAIELTILEHDTDMVLTGQEIDAMEPHAFARIAERVAVYARVESRHKKKIVETLQGLGHIVAMTGDGVNDAPALKKSDIGIAMGKTGTEVAKESAELILKDDNFNTIVHAIEQGRATYLNIRKFIYYLLVGNLSEVILILVAVLAEVNLPLTALMILFLNVVTSEVPILGMSIDKVSPDIMKQKPRNPKEGILSDYLLLKIANVVPVIVLGTLLIYVWDLVIRKNTLPHAQTVAFATLIFFELFHVFNARSWDKPIININQFNNIYVVGGVMLSILLTLSVIYLLPLQSIFGTVALTKQDWMHILIVSASLLFFMEIQKTIIAAEIKERESMLISPTRG